MRFRNASFVSLVLIGLGDRRLALRPNGLEPMRRRKEHDTPGNGRKSFTRGAAANAYPSRTSSRAKSPAR